MLLVTRVDHRRVLLLGLAGLVPAAVVTLLVVHQPAIGERRLSSLLRGPLSFAGLALAFAAAAIWATTPGRLTRSSLCGLAWAGVTTILCVGPFLESSPRARLYAFELGSGAIVWETTRAASAPTVVGDDLVVTDLEDDVLVGVDPATGEERWRREAAASDEPAAGDPGGVRVVGGVLRGTGDGGPWSRTFPSERVVAVAEAGDRAYAYVATPGAGGVEGGTVVEVGTDDGEVHWRTALPETIAAGAGAATIEAGEDAVIVAGGESVAALDAADGDLRWSHSIASLAKSRVYALPGAEQDLTVAGSLVFLSTTPER